MSENTTKITNLVPGTTIWVDTKTVYQDVSNNRRTSYSDENWDKLVRSLKESGQVVPATARLRCPLDGPETEGFSLVMVDGHTRSRARQEMKDGERDAEGRLGTDLKVTILPSLEDVVEEKLRAHLGDKYSETDVEEILSLKSKFILEARGKTEQVAYIVNTTREDWNCWAEAHSLQAQIDILVETAKAEGNEMSISEARDLVGKTNGLSGEIVKLRVSLLDTEKTPKDIQDKLAAGELQYSDALELRRIKDAEIRDELSTKAYENGWSTSQIRKAINKKVAEAESATPGAGKSIKSSRTRKKKEPEGRSNESLVAALSSVKVAIGDLAEEEEELLNQLLGAQAALEYVMTPSLDENFLDVLDRSVDAYFNEDEADEVDEADVADEVDEADEGTTQGE